MRACVCGRERVGGELVMVMEMEAAPTPTGDLYEAQTRPLLITHLALCCMRLIADADAAAIKAR